MREGGRFPDLLQELGCIVAQMQELLLLEYVSDHQSVRTDEAENPDHQLRLPGAVVRIDEDEPRGFPVLATNVFGPPEVHFVDTKGSGLSTECGATDISDLKPEVLHVLDNLLGVDEHVLVGNGRARGVRQARDNLVAAGDDVGTATV